MNNTPWTIAHAKKISRQAVKTSASGDFFYINRSILCLNVGLKPFSILRLLSGSGFNTLKLSFVT